MRPGATLEELMSLSFHEWEGRVGHLVAADQEALCRIGRQADALSLKAAQLSEYLAWRGGSGCGDHGHRAALKEVFKAEKRYRKALGYTVP